MKQTINFHEFREAFRRMDRIMQYTPEGLRALWDELTEFEESIGEEFELDVIAFCCDYCEDDPAEIAENYGIDLGGVEPDDVPEYVVEYMLFKVDGYACSFARLLDNGNIIYRSY